MKDQPSMLELESLFQSWKPEKHGKIPNSNWDLASDSTEGIQGFYDPCYGAGTQKPWNRLP